MLRPTFAEIDLAALRYNAEQLARRLPANAGLLAMVKADAYGHGAVKVAQTLSAAGVESFGVATVEEGIELRAAGITKPILVMGGLLGMGGEASRALVAAHLTPVIHSRETLSLLEDAAKFSGHPIAVHLKIDTGMGRLGVRPEGLRPLLEKLRGASWLRLEGVMTHLAKANDATVTAQQVNLFRAAQRNVIDTLGPIAVCHLANSIAILKREPVALDDANHWWARAGIALYGGNAGITLPPDVHLLPVMSLKSRIALTKWIPSGATVSYQCLFTAARKTRIAVVPIGYADGIPLSLTGKGCALVCGQRVPIIGRVTMDMVMLDITDVTEATVSDEVVFLGRQGKAMIGLDELAELAGTISYEICCRVSKRMPRVYKE